MQSALTTDYSDKPPSNRTSRSPRIRLYGQVARQQRRCPLSVDGKATFTGSYLLSKKSLCTTLQQRLLFYATGEPSRDSIRQKISHIHDWQLNNTQTIRHSRPLGDKPMAHANCKRIWEGTLGVAITPRKKHDGNYFWTFSLVRAFRRSRDAAWEYAQHFGQEHAPALGKLMSRAFQFMEQNDPAQFLAAAMTDKPSENVPPPQPENETTLDDVKLPPHQQLAA